MLAEDPKPISESEELHITHMRVLDMEKLLEEVGLPDGREKEFEKVYRQLRKGVTLARIEQQRKDFARVGAKIERFLRRKDALRGEAAAMRKRFDEIAVEMGDHRKMMEPMIGDSFEDREEERGSWSAGVLYDLLFWLGKL